MQLTKAHTRSAEAVEVAPGMYSILIDRISLEALVELDSRVMRIDVYGQENEVVIRDPRMWERERARGHRSELQRDVSKSWRQCQERLFAFYSSRETRLRPGQGNCCRVVEANVKMQNEVRSPKTGTLERILVTEGQAVNAGDVLGIVV